MFIRISEELPQESEIKKVVECLRDGGVIIYPTDTVYGIGCDIFKQRAIERVCEIKGWKPEKANLSFICSDLSHLADYTRPISTVTFKLLKRNLPGPFTFILDANNNIPKLFRNNKKTIGIRVPDNPICLNIIKTLGNPILSSSVHNTEDELLEYFSDPEQIYEQYGDKVDIVIFGGYSNMQVSTIVDCTNETPTIVRQGLGELLMS